MGEAWVKNGAAADLLGIFGQDSDKHKPCQKIEADKPSKPLGPLSRLFGQHRGGPVQDGPKPACNKSASPARRKRDILLFISDS
ncbi:MAG TPA: hypothetical protein ENF48_06270 [Desulfobacteraceae bacterium]|nr:hypothetical protein [Desulfobacteraceae bacterium]